MNVNTLLFLVVGISYADHQCQGGAYLETHDNGENYIWRHQRCPAGEFAPLTDCLVNQDPCLPCPYGFYQNQTGQTSCVSMTQTNCSAWPRHGLRIGATKDKCFFCENSSFHYVYRDGRCYSCGDRYIWRRDIVTNQTSCQKTNPLKEDYFKVLFALSIVCVATCTYIVDQVKFENWCYFAGATLNIVVSALTYYDTDISEEESTRWLCIGFLIEMACIGVYLVFKDCLSQKDIVAPQPEGGEKQAREQEIVCFE